MKNREIMQIEIHPSVMDKPLSSVGKGRVGRSLFGSFRKMFFVASLAGAGLLMGGCAGYGYVDNEPAYGVSYRTPQPSESHIWIDGGWGWNNQTHGYVQRSGYWERPRQNQTYISGSWQSSPKGKYWQDGHWQRNNNRNGRNYNNGNGNGNGNGNNRY